MLALTAQGCILPLAEMPTAVLEPAEFIHRRLLRIAPAALFTLCNTRGRSLQVLLGQTQPICVHRADCTLWSFRWTGAQPGYIPLQGVGTHLALYRSLLGLRATLLLLVEYAHTPWSCARDDHCGQDRTSVCPTPPSPHLSSIWRRNTSVTY